MSFAAQEQALLDLLFDRDRRAAFRRDPAAALAAYELSEDERQDFSSIRLDALEMDAAARVNFILAQYCRSFPLSFSLVSSLPEVLERLRRLVDASLIRTPPDQRLGQFGLRLRDGLQAEANLGNAREKALVMSIVEAELGMAWTAQQARQSAAPAGQGGLPPDWLQRPLRLAPCTSAAVLPRPYPELKAALCPVTGAELWRRLTREPLLPAQRQQLLSRLDLRLLVARAIVQTPVACEPVVEHVTVELGEGFARLLPHLDGRHSVSTLLAQLRSAGADDSVLTGVMAGFRQLWQNGMVEAVAG